MLLTIEQTREANALIDELHSVRTELRALRVSEREPRRRLHHRVAVILQQLEAVLPPVAEPVRASPRFTS
jgi:hypothetical protein